MNILQSILNYRCPRCRSSKLFKEPFSITNPLNMHQHCAVCKQNFEPEPGFYFGAMFISYGLSALLFLIPSLILVLGFDWSANRAMLIVFILAGMSFFKILRLSRSVWIHINVRYENKFKTASNNT